MGTKIKKDEDVEVITGDDKGKTGKVLQVLPETNRVLVEGLNFVKKHMKKTQDNPQGGVFEKEAPIHISNLKKTEQ